MTHETSTEVHLDIDLAVSVLPRIETSYHDWLFDRPELQLFNSRKKGGKNPNIDEAFAV